MTVPAADVAAMLAGRRALLADACRPAQGYLAGLAQRRVAPRPRRRSPALAGLDFPLPDSRLDPAAVHRPARRSSARPPPWPAPGRATSASSSAARCRSRSPPTWLAAAWDQNAALRIMSPAAGAAGRGRAALAGRRARPAGRDAAAASSPARPWPTSPPRRGPPRRARPAGWDVEADGLFGAPPITVVVGAEVHATLLKALGLLGLGRDRVVARAGGRPGPHARRRPARAIAGPTHRVPAGRQREQRRLRPVRPRSAPRPTRPGAWVHVDGAFGLWAAAAPGTRTLVAGLARGRLVGDRRAQVAERALRLRPRLRARPGRAARRDERQRRLPADGERPANPIDLHARVLAPGARRRGVGGAATARPRRGGRAGRARPAGWPGGFAAGLRAAGLRRC